MNLTYRQLAEKIGEMTEVQKDYIVLILDKQVLKTIDKTVAAPATIQNGPTVDYPLLWVK